MAIQENSQRGLERLSAILAFRLLVATVLLVVVALAQYLTWDLYSSEILYAIVVITYLTVIVVGLLASRFDSSPLQLDHLTANLILSSLLVQTTGGVQSGFTFLFILTIIDGAVLAGMPVALGFAGRRRSFTPDRSFYSIMVFPLTIEECNHR